MQTDTARKVREILEDQLGASIAIDTARLEKDLGADSLDTVEIVMFLEREFEISIPDAEADEHVSQGNTVADVIAYVEKRVAEKEPRA
jgi:acyl carrier protein